MKVGAATIRITPSVGIPILGHCCRISEGVHDDLWAKVIVIESNGEAAAIVGLDLAWPMPEGDYVKIRDAIESSTGIKGERVMVTCTHCHSGPAFQPHPSFPLPLKRQRELIDPWVKELPRRVAEATSDAASKLKDAILRFGKVEITGLTYNRRKRIPEGVASLINVEAKESRYYFGDTSEIPHSLRQQYMYWGMPRERAEELPPSLPDGPIDPDLSVLCFEDKEGSPIAILTNFACHAVATAPPVPPLISAGFPGVMCGLVQEATDGVCIFTPGASGNIRPYRSKPRGFEEVERIGLVLATATLKALGKARSIERDQINVASQLVEVAFREYPPREEIEREIRRLEEQFNRAKSEGRYAKAKQLLERINILHYPCAYIDWVNQKGTVKLELQAIRMGDVIFLGIPNEVNVSIGLELKEKAPADKLVLSTLTNGCYMYLLKREEYEEGGYEAAACRLAPGSGEKVIEAALKLMERMYSQ